MGIFVDRVLSIATWTLRPGTCLHDGLFAKHGPLPQGPGPVLFALRMRAHAWRYWSIPSVVLQRWLKDSPTATTQWQQQRTAEH